MGFDPSLCGTGCLAQGLHFDGCYRAAEFHVAHFVVHPASRDQVNMLWQL